MVLKITWKIMLILAGCPHYLVSYQMNASLGGCLISENIFNSQEVKEHT